MSNAARKIDDRDIEQTSINETPTSSDDLQAQVRKLQAEYQIQIAKLQESGNYAEMAPLAANFQAKIQKLVSDFQAFQNAQAQAEIISFEQAVSREESTSVELAIDSDFGSELESKEVTRVTPLVAAQEIQGLYDNSICSLNLDLTVYEGDRRSLSALLLDQQFVSVSEELLKDNPVQKSRKELMKRCLHLTQKMAPRLYQIAERCKNILGLKAELDFFVYEDYATNAACYPPENGKYIIALSSSLLEKFDDEEMTFVLGHEIGHAMFDHHCLPTGIILERGRGHLSPVHAMKIFAWKRNKEITADRVGLICTQNFEAVARAFFKLSSGITTATLNFELNDYLGQFTDLKNEMSQSDPEDWFSTHPFSPMRLKALEIFTRSEVYRSITGQGDGSITKIEMESEIREFMSLMEPSYLQDGGLVAEFMREFMFLGGYLIAGANGHIEKAEIDALSEILSREAFASGIKKVQSFSVEELKHRVTEVAEKLNMHLPPISRLNLIKDLSIIVYADGSIEEAEMHVLYQLCVLLEIHPEFADQVIAGACKVAE